MTEIRLLRSSFKAVQSQLAEINSLDESLASYKLGCLVQEVFDLKMVVIQRIELAKKQLDETSKTSALSTKPPDQTTLMTQLKPFFNDLNQKQ